MEKVPITRVGYRRILEELSHLRGVVRPEVLEDLREARAFGAKSDNRQWLLARERQAVLERKIRDLEEKLAHCEIFVGRKFFSRRVTFGVKVQIVNTDTGEQFTYEMVGPFESDVTEGRLSVESPLGSCLMGHLEGEEVSVLAPAGMRVYRIVEAKYEEARNPKSKTNSRFR